MIGISYAYHNIDLYEGGREASVCGAINRFAQREASAAWQSCKLARNGCGEIETLLSKEDRA